MTDKVTFKVVRHGIAELAGMLPIPKMGRFHDIKVHIKREIATTPQGQFFVLPGDSKPKERDAFLGSIKALFKKQRLPWAIKYSPVNAGYIVVRQRDLGQAPEGQRAPRGAVV